MCHQLITTFALTKSFAVDLQLPFSVLKTDLINLILNQFTKLLLGCDFFYFASKGKATTYCGEILELRQKMSKF